MHEYDQSTAGALPALWKDLEYIPVCSDPRGIYLSEMYEEDPEPEETSARDKQQPTLFEVMEKICRIVECLTCGGMIYVLARMAGIA